MWEPLAPLGVLPGRQCVLWVIAEHYSLLVVSWDLSLVEYVFDPTIVYSLTPCSGINRPRFVEMVCYLIDGVVSS